MTPERWHKIEEIYQTVIELPPAERARLLTQFCANDTALRREVEALLAEEETTDDFLQGPIKEAASTLQLHTEDDWLGQDIGPYHLRRLLGQGGMGAVYLAERADAEYYRQVALKIVRRGLDSRFVLKRFRVERQILATLAHPNIAQLLDGGTTASGLPYFVMEYIEGQPLTEYCNERQLTLEDRLRLFLPVCAAVQHAHQKLVVHRDLKPSNILVTPAQDGKGGVPKLLDFGIAKLLDPTLAPEDLTRTLTAMRLMTPDYASPEQVRGLPITTASDIYSLGAVLYELLTGVRPHRFETYTPAEIERVVCDTEIERPSSAIERMKTEGGRMKGSVSQPASSFIPHPSSLRGDLDNIVLMALRKEPERRYQSVEQLAEDIRRYLAGRPISARRESLVYRTEKFVRRNKLGVAATALIFFSLLGGIVTTARAARVAQRERARAEANLAEAQQQRSEAEKQRTEAEKQRAEADRQRNVAELERAEALAQSERAANKAAEAEAQRRLAETQRTEALNQRAEADRQRERAERRFGQVRKLANTFLFDFHDKIAKLAGSTEARELVVKTALEYLDSLAQEAEGDVGLQQELVTAYVRVGDVQGDPARPNLGQSAAALESYRRSIALAEKLNTKGQLGNGLLQSLLQANARTAEIHMRAGNRNAARPALQKTLELAQQLQAAGNKDEVVYRSTMTAYFNLGEIELFNGSDTNWLDYRRKIVEVSERAAREIGSAPARTMLVYGYRHLGTALAQNGLMADAKTIFNRALAVQQEIIQASPNNASSRGTLALIHGSFGNALMDGDEPQAAATQLQQAVRLLEEQAAQDPKDALARANRDFAYHSLGRALAETDPAQAVPVLKKALTRAPDAKPLPPAMRVHQIFDYLNLARALWSSGARAEVEPVLNEAQAILQLLPAKQMYEMGLAIHQAQRTLGLLCLDMGADGKALNYFEQALQNQQNQQHAQPKLTYLWADLAKIQEALGQYHVTLAARSNVPRDQQRTHWQEAQRHYQHSLNALREWGQRLPGNTQAAAQSAVVTKALAQCDTALAALGSQR